MNEFLVRLMEKPDDEFPVQGEHGEGGLVTLLYHDVGVNLGHIFNLVSNNHRVLFFCSLV